MLSLRRTKFDHVLVTAAREAGVQVLQGFEATSLRTSEGCVRGVEAVDHSTNERVAIESRVVVGADGRFSFVARAVEAPAYNVQPSLTGSFFGYFADLDRDRSVNEAFSRPPFEVVVFPTDDGLFVVNVVVARRALKDFRRRFRSNFFKVVQRYVPGASPKTIRSRLYGAINLPNYFRIPCGPGWVLVGDAGHHRDPIRAQGMHQALLDAESLSQALDAGLSPGQDLVTCLQRHHRLRDERVTFPYLLCLQAAAIRPLTRKVGDWLCMFEEDQVALQLWRGALAGSVSGADLMNYRAEWERSRR